MAGPRSAARRAPRRCAPAQRLRLARRRSGRTRRALAHEHGVALEQLGHREARRAAAAPESWKRLQRRAELARALAAHLRRGERGAGDVARDQVSPRPRPRPRGAIPSAGGGLRGDALGLAVDAEQLGVAAVHADHVLAAAERERGSCGW